LISVGILGATGYAGSELARILYRHRQVQVTSMSGAEGVGQRLGDFFPHLHPMDVVIKEQLDDVDVVLAALPHRVAAQLLLPWIDRGKKVVDLSADFRLRDVAEYEAWYQVKHPRPELLKEAVYGLPELHRKEIAKANLVASPGCYPTGAILAMVPAVKEGLIERSIIFDSKSGTSGAGRSPTVGIMLSEAGEGISAYALAGHRHMPEMTQELSLLGGLPCAVTFVPHLLPMVRGILTTGYASLSKKGLDAGEKGVREAYREFYKDEPFVRVVEAPPQTKHVRGSNFCAVYPTIDARTGRLVVVSCIDNLMKGAAGQAVQSMNLMLGLPETAGLEGLGLYP
jgi:N-acetyl-gamma-glutamyl-phosphate reductase